MIAGPGAIEADLRDRTVSQKETGPKMQWSQVWASHEYTQCFGRDFLFTTFVLDECDEVSLTNATETNHHRLWTFPFFNPNVEFAMIKLCLSLSFLHCNPSIAQIKQFLLY